MKDDPTNEHWHHIRCENCHKWFDVVTCETVTGHIENTINKLEDHLNSKCICPHCGFAN
jgi:Fe2+ or Zn2+ uptake regulation protein